MDMVVFTLLLSSIFRLTTPLLLAAMGELISEKAGVLNLSLEGMLLASAFAGAWTALVYDSAIVGLLFGIGAALLVAALQAIMTVILRADQVVVGLGINLLVLGLTTLLSRIVFGNRSQTVVPGLEPFPIPVLVDIPILGAALFNQNILVYLSLLSVPLTWILLHRTRFGLSVTAAGEDPTAADRSGVSVRKTRFLAVLCTGVFCGVSGVFYSLGDIKTFVEGMTNGAGFIALVAVIFGNWKVFPVFLACLFFGTTISLRFLFPAMQIDIPLYILGALPYVAALLAVMGVIGKQKPPAHLSIPYILNR